MLSFKVPILETICNLIKVEHLHNSKQEFTFEMIHLLVNHILVSGKQLEVESWKFFGAFLVKFFDIYEEFLSSLWYLFLLCLFCF